MNKITPRTLLPLSMVAMLAGGIVWLTTVYAQVLSNTKSVDEIKEGQQTYIQHVQSIDRRLAKIEGRLEIK